MRLDPENSNLASNYGGILSKLHQPGSAAKVRLRMDNVRWRTERLVQLLERSLERRLARGMTESPELRYNLGLLQLQAGDTDRGKPCRDTAV